MEMQKAVYLLQDMGVPVGSYGFRWYLHGPYSQVLQDDMHFESGRIISKIPELSNEYSDSIERLHQLIHAPENSAYSVSSWVECLASLQYLKKNVMNFKATMEDVIIELENRKKHLNNRDINIKAYKLLEDLFA